MRMNINEIKMPEDIYAWIDGNIQYGWMDIEGKKHYGEMKILENNIVLCQLRKS